MICFQLWSFESKNEGYTIHTCVKPVENEDLVFFAITTLKFPHNPASVFKEFVTKFVRTISVKDIDAAEDDGLTYSAQSVFKAVDQKYGVDKLKDTQAKVDGLKNQLHNNMQDLLERGEQLDEIQMNADQLDQDAKGFKATATDLKWKFCCLNAKWTILLTLFLITIITVIVVAAVCTSDPDACKQK
eukprot:974261-Amorphochlora_amoeboformis.AAC.2